MGRGKRRQPSHYHCVRAVGPNNGNSQVRYYESQNTTPVINKTDRLIERVISDSGWKPT